MAERDGTQTERASVIVAGLGPVGMTLALDLACRGVDVLGFDTEQQTTTNPRCNTTNARSMEYFRRLGIADTIRRAGLPGAHATDVVYCTALTGHELHRFPFSSSDEVLSGDAPEFLDWPTPEPQHRISQIFLEPILAEALTESANVTVRRGWRVKGVAQTDGAAEVTVVNASDGRREVARADFVVGCDGGSSTVRRSLGIRLQGDGRVAERRLSVYFRSDDLAGMLGPRPGWMYWWYGPRYHGSFVQLDGRSLFLCHARVPDDEDPAEADPELVVQTAVGRAFDHEIIQTVRWDPRRLVADRFRRGRVLLAGDAAHTWLPLGGFGMNTGIGDAMGLSWRLAAILAGHGGDRLLDDYAFERQGVGEATSRAALKIDTDMTAIGRDPELAADNETGRQLRLAAGDLIERVDRKQWYSQGVQFGARYVGSPGTDGASTRADTEIASIETYVPSVDPGARLPHYWRPNGSSVFDELGPDWTLLLVGPDAGPVDDLRTEAEERAVGLTVLELREPEAVWLYERRLVLCRPDMYVAWSGDAAPESASDLFDRLLGVDASSLASS